MKNEGYDVVNYIDDVIGFVTVTTVTPSYSALFKLLQELGFDISTKTLVKPCTKAICLGVEIDAESFTASVPEEKFKNIKKICKCWQNKTKCSKKELQSLLVHFCTSEKWVKSSKDFFKIEC